MSEAQIFIVMGYILFESEKTIINDKKNLHNPCKFYYFFFSFLFVCHFFLKADSLLLLSNQYLLMKMVYIFDTLICIYCYI